MRMVGLRNQCQPNVTGIMIWNLFYYYYFFFFCRSNTYLGCTKSLACYDALLRVGRRTLLILRRSDSLILFTEIDMLMRNHTIPIRTNALQSHLSVQDRKTPIVQAGATHFTGRAMRSNVGRARFFFHFSPDPSDPPTPKTAKAIIAARCPFITVRLCPRVVVQHAPDFLVVAPAIGSDDKGPMAAGASFGFLSFNDGAPRATARRIVLSAHGF